MDSSGFAAEYPRIRKDVIRETVRDLEKLSRESIYARAKDGVKRLLGRKTRVRDELFWPQGMLLLGLLEAGERSAVCSFFDRWAEKGSAVVYPDDSLAGYCLVRLYEMTGETRYIEGAEKIARFLSRTERDAEGSIIYLPGRAQKNILADGAGMTAMFLSRYGAAAGDSAAAEDARTQLSNFFLHATDARTGLPAHGYELAAGGTKGLVGWARGTAWLLMGIAECEAEGPVASPIVYEQLIRNVLQYQKDNGLFPWLLGDEGHTDTSATGMIAWSLIRLSGRCAWVKPYAWSMLTGLTGSIRKGAVDGSLAECLDLGNHPQIYGHYPWGQGAALAALECAACTDGGPSGEEGNP